MLARAEEPHEQGHDERPTIDYERLAQRGAVAAEDKKATDVMVIDLRGLSEVCDYFVLASGKTRLQTRAIANGIDEALDNEGVRRRRQGYQSGGWILLDYDAVVFHVFLERERDYYNLESLWAQAPVTYRGSEISTGGRP